MIWRKVTKFSMVGALLEASGLDGGSGFVF